MAEVAGALLDLSLRGMPVAHELAKGHCLRPGVGRGPLCLVVGDLAAALPQKLSRTVRADVRLLGKARAAVRTEGGEYVVPSLRTEAGHEVRHRSRRLVEAIAFEKEALPSIDAGNFGVFSAYCTQRDFGPARDWPAILPELIAILGEQDPADVPPHVHEALKAAQLRLLGRSIWGHGIELPSAEAERILAAALPSLTIEQQAQLVLMNGMHERANVLLALAVIAGELEVEDYLHQAGRGMQPDSPEEQELRTTMAYIMWYGRLASSTANDEPAE